MYCLIIFSHIAMLNACIFFLIWVFSIFVRLEAERGVSDKRELIDTMEFSCTGSLSKCPRLLGLAQEPGGGITTS